MVLPHVAVSQNTFATDINLMVKFRIKMLD